MTKVLLASDNILKIHFPYCVKLLNDNRYIILNRDYKPLGIKTNKQIVYEMHPSAYLMKITSTQAQKISWNNSPDLEHIFLYRDSDFLLNNLEEFKAYSERMKTLMKIKISETHYL